MADVDRIVSVGPPPEGLADRRAPRKRRKPAGADPQGGPAPAPPPEEPSQTDPGEPGQKHLDICV
jgi:hypothetical protein